MLWERHFAKHVSRSFTYVFPKNCKQLQRSPNQHAKQCSATHLQQFQTEILRQASIHSQNCKAECRGGFGVVLWGQVHREEAAIKLIKGRSREKEMLQEIAILERAKTNYVTRFLGYTVCPDGIMLCMEYMSGGTLYQALHINEEFQWRNRQAPWLLARPIQWSGLRYLFSFESYDTADSFFHTAS